MDSFKGRSILRMYVPKKPKKWGIKLWGRASPKGILHAFDVYRGIGNEFGEDDTDVLQLTCFLLWYHGNEY